MRTTRGKPLRKEPHERGELQRRIDAIIETGVLSKLSKPALLVFVQIRQWADFASCRTRSTSTRTIANHTKLSRSSAWRGIDQLLKSGVVVEVDVQEDGCRSFEFRRPPERRAALAREDRGGRRPWA